MQSSTDHLNAYELAQLAEMNLMASKTGKCAKAIFYAIKSLVRAGISREESMKYFEENDSSVKTLVDIALFTSQPSCSC